MYFPSESGTKVTENIADYKSTVKVKKQAPYS